MDPEGSLPHSQVPTTFPHPEPTHPVHTPTSHFVKIHLNIILPSTPGSSKWSLYLGFFPPKHCIRLSSLPYALHTLPILFSLLGPNILSTLSLHSALNVSDQVPTSDTRKEILVDDSRLWNDYALRTGERWGQQKYIFC
jgi:hypothetical protein